MTHLATLFLIFISCCVTPINSFNAIKQNAIPRRQKSFMKIASRPQELQGQQKKQSQDEPSPISKPLDLKKRVTDLLPRMKTKEDALSVQNDINNMESGFTPFQTLDFMNLAVGGEWKLLFSTKLRGGPRPNFRITEMVQKIEPSGLAGKIINRLKWEFKQDHNSDVFDCFGTFSVNCSYKINQGGRMEVELDGHTVDLKKKSAVPDDVPALFKLLNRNMPPELFDPNGHGIDTTYVDGDFKITRYTGPAFEGVRNIYIRTSTEQAST
mmetsp:Transcript_17038/g.25794  ORF Transcript_17038/g.25794 Transcript_17038/m.25794 type:complete len:268 (-) Transcript_17038:3633-4436(-)